MTDELRDKTRDFQTELLPYDNSFLYLSKYKSILTYTNKENKSSVTNFLIYRMKKKKYWYAIKKEGDLLKIFYRLEDEKGNLQFYQTQTWRAGNKRIRLIRTLMKNNWPVVTKRIAQINPEAYANKLNMVEWKEVDEEEMLEYLRRGNPDDNARSSLFQFFGYSIFGLTKFERRYFESSFHNLPRLVAFYHVIKKECKSRGTGYTHRKFEGRSIVVTPGKIKKAILELFKVDPQEVIYNKEKS